MITSCLYVPRADHEVVEAEVGVALHDVPQDGVPPDFDHGLGAQVTLLADARAEAPRQNNDLHIIQSSTCAVRSIAVYIRLHESINRTEFLLHVQGIVRGQSGIRLFGVFGR